MLMVISIRSSSQIVYLFSFLMSQFFSRKLKKKAPGPKMSKLKGNGHMIADSSKRMNGK